MTTGQIVATPDAHDINLEKEVFTLVMASTTMQREERDSWVTLIPKMNTIQMNELKRIILSEQEKLKAIDDKYQAQVKQLEKEYIEKYLTRKSRQKWEQARAHEESHLEESEQEAESILKSL